MRQCNDKPSKRKRALLGRARCLTHQFGEPRLFENHFLDFIGAGAARRRKPTFGLGLGGIAGTRLLLNAAAGRLQLLDDRDVVAVLQ